MRVKTGVVRHRRHKRLLKQARGFYSGRRKHFRRRKIVAHIQTQGALLLEFVLLLRKKRGNNSII